MTPVTIAGIPIGDGYPCSVIAEIGTNASGSLRVAKQMIEAAKESGATFVKFQARTPELAVPETEWNELRDTPFGRMTKLGYRKAVEFGEDGYRELFAHAERIGIVAFASVWDVPSVKRMERVGSPCHKIPSARMTDYDLLAEVNYLQKPTILSTGMSTWEEVQRGFVALPFHRTIVLQCTSAYPAQADESNLRVIQTYKRELHCPVGFSSHKIGIATCLLAVAVGANLIERHISLDRSTKGSDHRMSSEPEDLARLVKEIRYAEACLGDGVKRVYDSEVPERKRLRGQT